MKVLIIQLFDKLGESVGFCGRFLPLSLKRRLVCSLGKIVWKASSKTYSIIYAFAYGLVKRMCQGLPGFIFRRMFLEGFFMDLDVSKKTQRQLFLNKTYEPHISAYIRRNLKPGDYFMDIGANVGYYTMIAAVLVGDRGRVVSFEPEKDNFSRIRHNTDINGFTRCILENMAISDKSGKAVLHINPLNEGGHSLNEFGFYNDSLERWPKEEIERKFPAMEFEQEVACASIDDYMRENSLENPVPTVVKIDVEGFEMNVLKGMKILLMRFDAPDVVCEVQTGHGDAFDFMRAFGYKVYKLDRNGVPVVYSVEGLFKKGDYLFAKGSIS